MGSKYRTKDFAKLRAYARWYIPSIEGYPDIGIGTREDNSGFHHVATGRLLCPRRLQDDFDKNMVQFCRDVQNGHKVFGCRDWPSYLYPEKGYDPNAEEKGLLRSPLLVYVSPRIAFTRTANLSVVLPYYF
jgi:hypothetical protein